MVLCLSLLSFAEEERKNKVRTIIFNQDLNQKYMTTRVFKLNHIAAGDILPFIKGSIKRFSSESKIQRLNYTYGKEQYICVSTGVEVMPYIIDMVQKLDRPCKIKGPNNEIVDGDGIYRFVYYANYRATDNMRQALQSAVQNGVSYFDQSNNMFYWKDSLSSGKNFLSFLKAVDRPVPQLQITINTYILNENDFIELGLDYVSWKNGPGAKIFSAAFQYLDFDSWTNLANMMDIMSKGPFSSVGVAGAFLVAPQFDATFLRMLAQKGNAKSSTSGTLTVINDFFADPGYNNFDGAKYRLKFTPSYQSIEKDSERNISVDNLNGEDYFFYIRNPIITFNDTAMASAVLMCGWVLEIDENVEKTNDGTPVINKQYFSSWLTIDAGTEKLIGSYEKDIYVRQQHGIPFLSDIPIFKYLFGTTSVSKSKARIFITMKVDPVSTERNFSQWAGKVIEAAKITPAESPGGDK
jgi:hypothetical protein